MLGEPPRYLEGNLAEFPLPSLVGALMSAGRTGRLLVQPPYLEGEVFLQGGQVVHARARSGERALEGEEALDLLAGLRRAPFRFEPEASPPKTTLLGGLAVPARLAEAQAAWQGLALPADWGYVLRLPKGAGEAELTPEALRVLAQVEGKPIAEVLLSPGTLRLARILHTLLQLGALEAVPQVQLAPVALLVLPIYGPGSGVAYVDEALYAAWARAIRHGFRLRLRPPEALMEVRPRPHIQGRLGLLEEDLRRLRLKRGDKVEVVPEV
ncbi:DUF4388 domain-containing protein [Thermus thermamylovorans]|uniref:DUF4388 domain-containing protein n=1 Tax=Thermus thermamylovorans TaxID=2509362 RepID=A0A4Q9B0H2_9DEIN|nr:DUF4388 domain-containing protein [Thermus thermamylovorans]TBH17552.1 DUF4388 domain-containing protein [Thermus thermamylovorans]